MKGVDDRRVTSARKAARERREYATPKLTQWGNIHTLTQGGAGAFPDFPISATRKDS